ncbi:MAG: type IV pilus biogenesis/stability protein PilW [Granulosicoccaceae bacterium]|jgi:type IV pilus assembly protein PilF
MIKKFLYICSLVVLSSLVLACGTTGTTVEGEGDVTLRPEGDKLARTNVQLGVGYMRQGKYEFALSKLRKALEIDDALPDAHYAIALLYERLTRPEHARRHYERAIALDPQYSDAHNAYAVFLCRNKEFEQADLHFQAALKNPLYRSPQVALLNAGVCMYNSESEERLERAEQYFRSVLKQRPKQPQALFNMAKINFDQANYLRARAYLQRYLEVARHTAETLWLGIRVERILGDKNALASYSLLLKENFPDSDEAKKLLTTNK